MYQLQIGIQAKGQELSSVLFVPYKESEKLEDLAQIYFHAIYAETEPEDRERYEAWHLNKIEQMLMPDKTFLVTGRKGTGGIRMRLYKL